MKKVLLFGLILIGTLNLSGQEKILSVQGVARIKEKPELIVITGNLIVKDSLYNECFEKALEKINVLKDIFSSNGIHKDKIKSKEIIVSESFKWEGNTRIKVGYSTNIEIEIEEIFTQDLSKKLLKSLSTKGLDLNYKIQFAFSKKQKDELRKSAIKEAVRDAKEKAEILSSAAGLNLKGIIKIDYKTSNVDFAVIEDDLIMEEMIPITRQQDYSFGQVDLNPKESTIIKSVFIDWEYE